MRRFDRLDERVRRFDRLDGRADRERADALEERAVRLDESPEKLVSL